MPKVAQKLRPASVIIGSITLRLRNVEAGIATGDVESVRDDFYLVERSMRMLGKYFKEDDADDTDSK